MNPLFRIDFSISDSLKIVRKSVLIYETIIVLKGVFHLTALSIMKVADSGCLSVIDRELPEYAELKICCTYIHPTWINYLLHIL